MVGKLIKCTKLRSVAITLLLILPLVFAGCNSQTSKAKPSAETKKPSQVLKKPINFTELTIAAAPKQVQELAKQNREKASTTLVAIDREPYLVVTRGLKTTGGYDVKIQSVNQELQAGVKMLIVSIKYTDPQPGQIVTQALTYPTTVAKLDLKSIPMGVSFIIIQSEQNPAGQT